MLYKDLLDEHIRRECLECISVTLASSERWCANTILYLVCSSNKFFFIGGLAQMGERLLCTQKVNGSIPLFSTNIDHLC